MLFIFVLFILRNDNHINVMKRDIPRVNFMKAYVVTIIYLTALVIAIIVLCISETAPFLAIIFECFSAIATVGLSMDLTPLLSVVGKLVIIALMFIGRVGPITIVVLIFRVNSRKKLTNEVSYAHGDILIG
jgi:trk system potassium uptake protein